VSRKFFAGIVGVGLVALLAVWLWRREAQRSPIVSFPPIPIAASRPQESNNPIITLDDKLRSAAASLGTAQRSELPRRLAELRQALAAASASEGSAAIRRFLDSKSDGPTGMGFKVGKNGVLDQSPTLRTFLLDALGQIDPATAAAYAREILNNSTSPDEWAVALRNLATGDSTPEGRKLLEDKTSELLRNEAWQREPSAGYLEAFDTAVYLGGTNLVAPLTDLVCKKDNQAVAHAAFLSLDRLVIKDPVNLLNALESQPELMEGREQTRANYFARADVRGPEQKQAIERYLLDPKIGAAELDQFAGLYPNANFMISANLLTPMPTPVAGDLVARDAESLRVVSEWVADDRFSKIRPQLEKVKARLQEFVRQASTK
jgi:hypothetical protein